MDVKWERERMREVLSMSNRFLSRELITNKKNKIKKNIRETKNINYFVVIFNILNVIHYI